MANSHLTVLERFWMKVDKNGPIHPDLGTPCWLWTAGINRVTGYGKFWSGIEQTTAHRFVYEECVGPIPAGHFVLHRCDVRACVNYEAHLFTGTQTDNMMDKTEKGRQAHSGRCGRTRLTAEQVREIRHALTTEPRWPNGRSLGNRRGHPPGLAMILATRYGVSKMTIWKIDRGTTWTHLQ
jgi:HNH endonuclease